jgi:hypothetical protein
MFFLFSYRKMITVDGEECRLNILDCSETPFRVSGLFCWSNSFIFCPSFFLSMKRNSCLEIQDLIYPFKLSTGSYQLWEGCMIVYSITNRETFDYVEKFLDAILRFRRSDEMRVD